MPPIDVKWNIWKVDKDGKPSKWIGMIADPKTAFQWFRDQDLDPSQYRVNNIPPASGMTPNPDREVWAMTASDIREGDTEPPRKFSQRPSANPPRKPKAERKPAVRRTRKKVDTPEMKKMKADAAELLEQHKADEAAELAKEKGNGSSD
jgi:hypothetical protein